MGTLLPYGDGYRCPHKLHQIHDHRKCCNNQQKHAQLIIAKNVIYNQPLNVHAYYTSIIHIYMYVCIYKRIFNLKIH